VPAIDEPPTPAVPEPAREPARPVHEPAREPARED
jgi:hypothetical protein